MKETIHELAKRYGYVLRSALDGYFLNEGGDDLMRIIPDGSGWTVDVYAHDANAYFVACLIRDSITANGH